MLINLTNHPSCKWDQKQTETAERQYGEIVDIPFPIIMPEANETQVNTLVDECIEKINKIGKGRSFTVHVMGEMTFTVSMVKRLQAEGVTCIASTTERKVTELTDGKRVTQFNFVQFRRYM